MDDNVKQAVPFFAVRDMSASLAFYVDALGFTMQNKWIDDGVLRWCCLEIGGAALMPRRLEPSGTIRPSPWVQACPSASCVRTLCLSITRPEQPAPSPTSRSLAMPFG